MTEQLVHDPAAVGALSAQVASRTGIPLSHIEKDFWVTEVLRGVVGAANAGGIEIVFKGGTSLSKAFSLIERFSEDVDVLAILPAALGKGARDTILKSLVNGAATATGLPAVAVPSATSTGLKRGARFHYTEQSNTFGLSDGVFLEIGSRGGAMPATVMPIVSILAETQRLNSPGSQKLSQSLFGSLIPAEHWLRNSCCSIPPTPRTIPTTRFAAHDTITMCTNYFNIPTCSTSFRPSALRHFPETCARTQPLPASKPMCAPPVGSPIARHSRTVRTFTLHVSATSKRSSSSSYGPTPTGRHSTTASTRSTALATNSETPKIDAKRCGHNRTEIGTVVPSNGNGDE